MKATAKIQEAKCKCGHGARWHQLDGPLPCVVRVTAGPGGICDCSAFIVSQKAETPTLSAPTERERVSVRAPEEAKKPHRESPRFELRATPPESFDSGGVGCDAQDLNSGAKAGVVGASPASPTDSAGQLYPARWPCCCGHHRNMHRDGASRCVQRDCGCAAFSPQGEASEASARFGAQARVFDRLYTKGAKSRAVHSLADAASALWALAVAPLLGADEKAAWSERAESLLELSAEIDAVAVSRLDVGAVSR